MVLKKSWCLPFQVSLQAKQLMYQLLHRDPKNRLGSREGTNEIKSHPFFWGVNWTLIRNMVNLKPIMHGLELMHEILHLISDTLPVSRNLLSLMLFSLGQLKLRRNPQFWILNCRISWQVFSSSYDKCVFIFGWSY